MKKSLSPRQADALAVIRRYNETRGRPPSFGEIAEGIGVKSRGAASHLLLSLEKKGYITREPGKDRAIRVLTGRVSFDPVAHCSSCGLLVIHRDGAPRAEHVNACRPVGDRGYVS